MFDWLKKIGSFIAPPTQELPPERRGVGADSKVLKKFDDSQIKSENKSENIINKKIYKTDKTDKTDNTRKTQNPPVQNIPSTTKRDETSKMTGTAGTTQEAPEEDDNLKALRRLRDQPRGTQVEVRIAAIENLLTEGAVFKTLKKLRWPQGVICPKCRSVNVTHRKPPINAVDQRHYYTCLQCESDGNPSDFDDFSGLPVSSMYALRQWILCWYMIGFCSITQIAQALGISTQQVLQIASLGNDLAEFPEMGATQTLSQKGKKTSENERKRNVEQDEDYTKSASKSPFKPGYKSKK